MDKKEACSDGMGFGCKATAAIVLLVIGGVIGFFSGRHCGTCPVTAATVPTDPTPIKQACTVPEESARGFLIALSKQEANEAVKYGPRVDPKTMALYAGMKVISVGPFVQPEKPIKYGGVYVPYEIVLKSGETKRAKLALRNDNPAKCYFVDGGY